MKYAPLSLRMIQVYVLSMLFFTAGSVLTVVFPLQASDSGMSDGEIGVAMGSYMLVCMILRPWAGQLVAKHGALRTMLLLLVGHAVTLLVYVAFGIGSLYAVRIMQGVVTAFFSMAIQWGIADLLADRDRGQGMSLYAISSIMPSLYGPAAALWLWLEADRSYLPLLVASLAVVPLLLMIRSPLPQHREPGASFTLRDMLQALKQAGRHRGLISASITMVAGACVFGAITTFLPLYMNREQIGNPALYLFLQAVVVVASRFVLRKRIPSDGQWHPRFIALVLLGFAVGTALLGFGSTLGPFVYIGALFSGLATAMLYPTITTYFTFAVPPASKHMLLGVFLATYDLGTTLGSFAMGFVVQWTSFATMFLACAGVAALASGYAIARSRYA